MKFDDSNITEPIIEKQLAVWAARRRAAHEGLHKESNLRFLTLARDEGSLENEIAQGLSRHLGWNIFDQEIVTHIAKNSHVSENLVRGLDQKNQGIFQDAVARLLQLTESESFGREEYHEALIRTLVCLSTHGSVILVGRGANFALREYGHGLNVRLIASPDVRAQRLSKAWKITVEAARDRMRVGDHERRKFIRRCYGYDFDDIGFYDLVYNTDRLSASQVVSSILSAMKHEETRTAEKETSELRRYS